MKHLDKKALQEKLSEINASWMNMLNFKVVERDNKTYVIETNEVFSSWDENNERNLQEINDFLAPGFYLETEITNVHYVAR